MPLKTSERLHTISIFLAGGDGFYYSSQRENSQETKYINFRVTKKYIENSKYLFERRLDFNEMSLSPKKFRKRSTSC